jgi:hypothetical protein
LQQCELISFLKHTVSTVTSDQIIATITLDNTVAFDTIIALVIPLVALLTSTPETLHEGTPSESQCTPESKPVQSYWFVD